jgi:hypothetical protein
VFLALIAAEDVVARCIYRGLTTGQSGLMERGIEQVGRKRNCISEADVGPLVIGCGFTRLAELLGGYRASSCPRIPP